jgi:hypothetical protein
VIASATRTEMIVFTARYTTLRFIHSDRLITF